MSSALVRQALEFVEDEPSGKGNKRRKGPVRPRQGTTEAGRDHRHLYKSKRPVKNQKPAVPRMEDNLKKLLALSRPTASGVVTEKIMQRAVQGRPLLEKIEIKTEEEKSILFPEEESFKKFEKEYFCN